MKKIILLSLLASSFAAHAQVYKCSSSNRTVYQSEPCPSTEVQSTVEIQDISPERMKQAQQDLQRIQKEAEDQKLADEAAEKERQKELKEQAVIDALNRAAAAEEQRARAEESRSNYNPYYPPYLSPGIIIPGIIPRHPGAGHGQPQNPQPTPPSTFQPPTAAPQKP